jgi:hypothetical protein
MNQRTGSKAPANDKWPCMTELPARASDHLSTSRFALAFAGAAAFLYLRTFLLPGTPFVAHDDQTLFFARATHILQGQVIYRDFFEFVPPGTELLYAAGFRIFGVHAWLLQAWSIALGLALFSAVTLLARRIFNGPLILLPGLLFLVFNYDVAMVPTHHWFSTLATLAAVATLAGRLTLPRIVSAGLLCAIATLFTQSQGALTFAALLLFLVWPTRAQNVPKPFARIAAFIVPYLLILVCVLGWYAWQAGPQTLFFDLVTFPLHYLSGDFNSPRAYLRQFPPLHSFAGLLRLIPYLFIYALVPYIYFVGAYQLWRKRRDSAFAERQPLVVLHLAGIALVLAVATGPRFYRLCTVAPPAILICVWILSGPGPIRTSLRRSLVAIALFFALLVPVYRQTQHYTVLDLPIGRTAFSDPEEFREFQFLAQRTRPGETFFNNSGLALYLSLSNPTAVEFVNYDDFTRPEQVTAVLNALQQHPPRFIALDPQITPPNPRDHSAPFLEYVHQHYALVQTFAIDHNSRPEEIWVLKPWS